MRLSDFGVFDKIVGQRNANLVKRIALKKEALPPPPKDVTKLGGLSGLDAGLHGLALTRFSKSASCWRLAVADCESRRPRSRHHFE